MILYPAIDLKDGHCVRLYKGEMTQATVFNTNPVAQALAFERAGCSWLHLVDLNGAFEGAPVNTDIIEDILSHVKIPVQLGGGIRDIATIEMWLSKGLSRIILGTVAVEKPELVYEATRYFPNHIAVGIDARNGQVATHGWATKTNLGVIDLARQFEDAGVSAIIYTDINRDGAMQGVNVEATATLAHSINIPVIASGGVSSIDDLRILKECGAPLNGVISGRAIYDGVINLDDAIKVLGTPSC